MKRLMKDYLKPYWLEIILIVILTLSQVIVQLMVITETKDVLNQGLLNGDMGYIVSSGAKMLALTIVYGAIVVTVAFVASRLTATLVCRMRKDTFTKIVSFSQTDFNHFGGSSLMTRITADATRMQIFFINIFRDMLQIPVVIIALIVISAHIDPILCAILTVAFIATMLFLVISSSRTLPRFVKVQEKLDSLNNILKEKLDGVRTIRAFGRQDHETRRFDELNDDFNSESYEASLKLYYLTPVGLLAMNLVILVIYYVGTIEIRAGLIGISDLILFFQYVAFFISCLAIVPFIVKTLPKTVVSSARLEEVLYYENTMDLSGSVEEPINGDLEFKDVGFGYQGNKEVVSGISFTVKEGTTTAIIGSTGSGKSTIINMVTRMYDPTSGEVRLGGKDIRQLDLTGLRGMISYAPQRTMVLNDTVYSNVSMGSEMSRERVEEACRITRFDEALSRMPEGIDTVMTQGGMNVSGGQRQRLSLARTVAKDADIYLFDDCFSALDVKTEEAVRAAIKKELSGKTILMIAQKINTIRDADNIVVMDKGRIVAQGNHDALLRECSLYREMYEVQSYISKGDE